MGLLMMLARIIGDVAFRDLPVPLITSVLGAGLIALGYTCATYFLTHTLNCNLRLARSHDIIILLVVAGLAALVVAVGYVLLLYASGLLAWEMVPRGILRRWVGDAIGIATLTPFLLVHLPDRTSWRQWLPRHPGEVSGQVAAIGTALWMIFGVEWSTPPGAGLEFQFFYLLFLPLIWIAVRSGLPGVTAGLLLTQLGLITAIQLAGDYSGATVTSLQTLMMALACASLLLGSVVSERRRTETLLRDSESRLQTLVNTAPDGILTLDADGRIESLNPAAERLFAVRSPQLTGTPITRLLPDLTLPHPGPAGEMLAIRPNGETVPVEVATALAQAENLHSLICVIRDISPRRQIEARLQEKQAELAHVSRLSMVGEMASALAHEMNQPLAAIANYTRATLMLMHSPQTDPARLRMALEKTAHQAERAGEIIRRLRTFLGKGDSQPAAVSLPRLIDDVLELVRPTARQSGVRLHLDLPDSLPPVFADRIQIEQVLLNLIRNGLEAVNSQPPGSRTVTLSAARLDPTTLRISVHDNGPGLAEDVQDRLFQPFTSTKTTGMGLGLSISRSIIEAHGGKLWCQNLDPEAPSLPFLPSGGTLFHFTLPVATDMLTDMDACDA